MTVRIDNRLEEVPMAPVTCRACEACVHVRKGSWNQTSVQWNAGASARCLERRDAEKVAAYSSRGVFLTCSALADSVVGAVQRGKVPVVDEID